MKYRVIKRFTDLQDGNHLYNEGDTFPREGVTVTEERLVELSTAANRRHIPLIEAVEDGTGTPIEVKAADLPDSGKAVKIVEGHFDEKALSTMKVDGLSKLAADLGVDIFDSYGGYHREQHRPERCGFFSDSYDGGSRVLDSYDGGCRVLDSYDGGGCQLHGHASSGKLPDRSQCFGRKHHSPGCSLCQEKANERSKQGTFREIHYSGNQLRQRL